MHKDIVTVVMDGVAVDVTLKFTMFEPDNKFGNWSDGTNCGLIKFDKSGWVAFVHGYGWTPTVHTSINDALEEVIFNAAKTNDDLVDIEDGTWGDDDDHMYDNNYYGDAFDDF